MKIQMLWEEYFEFVYNYLKQELILEPEAIGEFTLSWATVAGEYSTFWRN